MTLSKDSTDARSVDACHINWSAMVIVGIICLAAGLIEFLVGLCMKKPQAASSVIVVGNSRPQRKASSSSEEEIYEECKTIPNFSHFSYRTTADLAESQLVRRILRFLRSLSNPLLLPIFFPTFSNSTTGNILHELLFLSFLNSSHTISISPSFSFPVSRFHRLHWRSDIRLPGSSLSNRNTSLLEGWSDGRRISGLV